uniref:VM domain-containing protein n=1 Tax=Anopheles farauti TaxID=69004 RepID=A0A182QLH5_9DIPT
MLPSIHVLLVAVIVPASVLSAPTVHLQDQFSDTAAPGGYDSHRSVNEAPSHTPKPDIVEPTWITVPMPAQSYKPPVLPPQQPQVMPPYVAYIPVPPQHYQPMGWPYHYPNMPVLPIVPNNHLCNHQLQYPYRTM